MASDVRCGSTYVAETLSYELHESFGFELWDLTKELFDFLDENTTADALLTKWSSLFIDRSGFVAAKFMCKSLSHICRLAQQSPEVREAFFGEQTRWIVLRRVDRIEQAVSLALATRSGMFHHYGDDPPHDADVELTLEDMDWALKAVALSDVYLRAFALSLARERALSIFYRDFVSREAEHINRTHRLCGFPEIDPASYVNRSKLKPTAQRPKREARARFTEWFLAHYA